MEFNGLPIRRMPELPAGPPPGSSCTGCLGDPRVHGDTRFCRQLPPCGAVGSGSRPSIFIYDTPEAYAEYVALKLEG